MNHATNVPLLIIIRSSLLSFASKGGGGIRILILRLPRRRASSKPPGNPFLDRISRRFGGTKGRLGDDATRWKRSLANCHSEGIDDTDEVDLSVGDVGGEDGPEFDFRFVNVEDDDDDDLHFVARFSDTFFERCFWFNESPVASVCI